MSQFGVDIQGVVQRLADNRPNQLTITAAKPMNGQPDGRLGHAHPSSDVTVARAVAVALEHRPRIREQRYAGKGGMTSSSPSLRNATVYGSGCDSTGAAVSLGSLV